VIEPVVISAVVPLSPERAFALFTSELGSWWPLRTHSIGQEHAAQCGLEPGVGGDCYELLDDGTRHSWGRVIVWEPPHRVAFTWHPGMPESDAQQVEVRFTPDANGTRVELNHHNWEVLGDRAAEVRAGYANGWKHVFGERYVNAARAEAEVHS